MTKSHYLCLFLLVFLVGCSNEAISKDQATAKISAENDEPIVENEPSVNAKEPIEEKLSNRNLQENILVTGPGGCSGSACDEYFRNNPEESQKWCNQNPEPCSKLKGDNQGNFESPGNCGHECEQFCAENEQECISWCDDNPAKNPELCAIMDIGDERESRQGDGVWEKDELAFYILDSENILTPRKREVIIGTITSQEQIGKAFLGWNAALEELNNLYPDNVVPDRIVEVAAEGDADLVIEVHSQKEYCCDLAGLPVKGTERSTIDDIDAKVRSDVDIYNIINIDLGFLEDMAMHELGHSLGLFGHVTDRSNDLMSIISPGRGIKEGNINDLYVKYRDRKIETVEETRERDQSVRDNIVGAPD